MSELTVGHVSVRQEHLQANIGRMFWIRLLQNSGAIMVPGLVPLWKSCGLNMGEITLLQAIFAVTMIMLEVPTGCFADRLGRRASLMMASVMLIFGQICYFQASGFLGFLSGELLMGVGFSFASGADQALLYDTLRELGRAEDYEKTWGRVSRLALFAMAVFSILGGALSSIHLRLPLVAELFCYGCLLPMAALMVEPKRVIKPRVSVIRDICQVAQECLVKRPILRWLVLFPAIINGFNQVALWLYQPYLELCGLSLASIGLVFASMNIMAGVASGRAGSIAARLGRKRSFIAPLVLLVLSYFLMGIFVLPVSVIFIWFQQFVRGYSFVTFPGAMNREVGSERRATALSIQSMAFRLVYSIVLVPTGCLVDSRGIPAACGIIGIVTLLIGVLSVIPLLGVAEKAQSLKVTPRQLLKKVGNF